MHLNEYKTEVHYNFGLVHFSKHLNIMWITDDTFTIPYNNYKTYSNIPKIQSACK